MQSLEFTLVDGVEVQVVITELDDGSLKFDLEVLNNTGTIGDLRGVFFDLHDDSLTSGLSITGNDVTDQMYKADAVSNLGGGNNVNGDIVNEYGKFDVGVELGTQGISTDDIRSTSFILSHDSVDLSLTDIALQDFAVRLMSVGDEDGSRNGSLKIGGEVPPEPQPEYEALDDYLTVRSDETAGDMETLSTGALSILANDTLDGLAYLGDVLGVNGQQALVGQIATGSNGGKLILNADGSLDFDAGSEFSFLLDGESAVTTFEYEIEDSKIATVHVTVEGMTVRAANDDFITVSASESAGDLETLESGASDILANDTQNASAYTETVATVEGSVTNVNTFVAGSAGGFATIYADGTVDFDAAGAFDYLLDGETASTLFSYSINGGETAQVVVTVTGETEREALDDAIVVTQSETSGDLDGNVLDNDLEEAAPYAGDVVSVNGNLANVGAPIVGSNGGLVTINANGTFDFDANGEFDTLGFGQSAITTFSYEIDGGETANLQVTVEGEEDSGPTVPAINVAIILQSSSSMFAQGDTQNYVPDWDDHNGDGVANQQIDLAYAVIEDFMPEAYLDASNAGRALNVALVGMSEVSPSYSLFTSGNDVNQWIDDKITADSSADYGQGFANADVFFDDFASSNDDNIVFFIGNGFQTHAWQAELSNLTADHSAHVDAYLTDLVVDTTNPNYVNLSGMDKDGFVDLVYADDPLATGGFGVAQDMLTLTEYV